MQSDIPTIDKILYQEVINNIKNYRSLVLAFSGGLDSTVLLDILYNIHNNTVNLQQKITTIHSFKLRALHIHHGLSNNADSWMHHCAQECEKRHISFHSIRVNCDNSDCCSNGIESAARKIRYQQLFNNLKQKEILLTAQHLNDQSETFLLALKRGSGPSGLSGMPKEKFIYNHQLLRPLLQCSKEQIKKYATSRKLTWITDESNMDIRFDRNFLRLDILPKLKKRWQNINQNIARSAKLCAEQERLLDELLKQELKKLCYHDHSLLVQPLINMSTEKRQALLRRWLVKFNIQMPSYKKLCHIWKNAILSKQDATPIIQLNKKFLLRRFQNRLYIVPIVTHTSLNDTIIHWMDIKENVLLPHKLGVLIPKISTNTHTHSRDQKKICAKIIVSSQNTFSYIPLHQIITTDKILGLSLIRAPYKQEITTIKFNCIFYEKISIIGKLHRKKMKKIWQEFKIPPWVRKNIPLLFYNNKLIAALGVFVTKDGNIKKTDKELKIYWIQKYIPEI